MSTVYPIDDSGIWIEQRRTMTAFERILFCDRDGVIIHDRNYLSDPDGVELIDGIAEILAAAELAGVPLVVVTNQSGVGRGYFGWDAFAAVQERMMMLLDRAGIAPMAVLACPHHPQAQPPYRDPDPVMRKPNPGMLLTAARLYGIDPTASLMIGDKHDDMEAAARAGLHRGVLVDAATPRTKHVSVSGGFSQMVVDVVATVRAALPPVMSWLAHRTDCTHHDAAPRS